MKYSVGQVIYAILHKKGQVYPLMVVEEITKRTIKGEVVSYIVQVGAEPSNTSVLDNVEGELFNNPDEAKNVLITRATSQIEKVVENAVKKAQEWYQHSQAEEEIHELPPVNKVQAQTVTLPDGTVARINLPRE